MIKLLLIRVKKAIKKRTKKKKHTDEALRMAN